MVKILISPINEEEIIETLKGEPDIIDIKNPKEGSLGASFPWIIKNAYCIINEYLKSINFKKEIKLSAVIGDFPNLPGSASLAALGAAVCGADYIKIGLMGPSNEEEALNIIKNVVKSVKEYDNNKKVVISGYADFKYIKKSINPLILPKLCNYASADVVMVDTAIKNGKSLFDNLSINEIGEFIDISHEYNLEVAIAGSLKFEDLKIIKKLNPDIIGVRSMVCENFDRNNGKIQSNFIKQIKYQLNSIYA